VVPVGVSLQLGHYFPSHGPDQKVTWLLRIIQGAVFKL
jgi:hypothetical protein